MTDWTVVIGPSVNLNLWAEDVPIEALVALHDWLALCRDNGPPADAWLVELEEGYRYRYWLIEVNVTIEFIAVTFERWMLVTRVD